MFWDTYIRLCAKVGKAPNVIARNVCGVKSSGTVTGWKNGAIPRNGVLQQLAEYFGVTTDYLLIGEEPKAQKEKLSTPEGAELDEKAQSILSKYNQLDRATQTMFESMLDAAIAAKGKRND